MKVAENSKNEQVKAENINESENEMNAESKEEAPRTVEPDEGQEVTEKESSEADNTEKSEDSAPEEVSGPEKDKTMKEKLFGKKEKKKDPKDLQIEELLDRSKRQMAEFDNFRKRTEKEKATMYEIGAKDIIEKILPIVDNFERGFDTISEEEKTKPFVQGMEKVFKQLTKALEEAGVKQIEAVGKPFDPKYHNAVMHVDDENLGENIVADEFQKGYTYRDSVVRHSMVKVAN